MPYLSPANPRILAHRGGTEGGAIENTIEAFQFALDAGLNFLEIDVQATKDGVVVVFHDGNLQRLTGFSGKVSDLTLYELRELKLGERSRIPTLQEVLERFPAAKFNVDLKSKQAISPFVELILAEGAKDRVLVTSFSRSRRLAAVKALKNIATSADAITTLVIWLAHRLRISSLFRSELAKLSAIQIPRKFGPFAFDKSFVAAVQAQGVEVHFWTINTVADAEFLINDLGAKGIVTDKGKMMVEHFA